MQGSPQLPELTSAGCVSRQQRLHEALAGANLAGALICDRRHIHYLTGYWGPASHTPLAVVTHDAPTTLAVGAPAAIAEQVANVVVYESHKLCTMVDDQFAAAAAAIEPALAAAASTGPLGCDGRISPSLAQRFSMVEIGAMLHKLRRTKDEDEAALIQFAVQAAEATYHAIRRRLTPGVKEVDLFGAMYGAAAAYVGEPIGELGNDFKIGGGGGAPRRRPAQAGEIAIFDVSVIVRGYWSDMSRAFVVGGQPSRDQQRAHEAILAALGYLENTIAPGVSCKAMFDEVTRMLDGLGGWSFKHHLGHGIGLSAHEAPRLNPHHDDHFQVGDLFTAEPGLYGADLRAGMRLEQVYHLTGSGLERLTTFPTDLVLG